MREEIYKGLPIGTIFEDTVIPNPHNRWVVTADTGHSYHVVPVDNPTRESHGIIYYDGNHGRYRPMTTVNPNVDGAW